MNNKFCDDFCDGTKRCKTINCIIVMQLGQFNTKQKKLHDYFGILVIMQLFYFS